MKNEIIKLFKHLENANGYSIVHHIRRNPHIQGYLNEQFELYPEFGNICNIIRGIIKGITKEDLPKCKTCGKTIKCSGNYFIHNKHYEHCSNICKGNSQTVKQKRINTNVEKYGVDNVFKSVEIRKKIENTTLEKYGVKHIGLSKELREKRDKIMLDKYGYTTGFVFPETRIAINTKKYIDAYKNMKRFNNSVIPNFTEEEFIKFRTENKQQELEWHCNKCNNNFKQVFSKNSKFTRCYVCNPILNDGISTDETAIFKYIQSIYADKDIIQSDTSLIKPKELDIVIPSKKIAIEFNGCFWHSERFNKDINYHLNKTNLCNNIGYRLIHIFEDEWESKQQIVKNKLKSLLGKVHKKIYARKCEVKEITCHIKDIFLEKYHIQGTDKSSIKLGLFYKNRLVAVMTFGKRRFDDKEGFELIRYTTIFNFSILGGAGKLLAYFRKLYPGETIISYADKRWSTGNLYKQLGFTLIRESIPNYWYLKEHHSVRLSRQQFQKHKLKKLLHIFDENASEVENMHNNGYFRIWDCGNYVFELT